MSLQKSNSYFTPKAEAEIAHYQEIMPKFSPDKKKKKVVLASHDELFKKEILNRALQKGFEVIDFWKIECSNTKSFDATDSFFIADFRPQDFGEVQKRISFYRELPVVFVATTQRAKRLAEFTYRGRNNAVILEKKDGPNRILESGLSLLRGERYELRQNQYA